jgi:tetratricopeptide (TPR) repeat protein
LKPSAADLAAAYFLDDVAGATIPGSRLQAVLERVEARRPLTVIQQAFLQERGYDALLRFALGGLDEDGFRNSSRVEQESRISVKLVAEQISTAEQHFNYEATERTNKALFAKREKQLERRRFLTRFGQGYIERAHYSRVMQILQSVADGKPIENKDILWLGSCGSEYWTEELRRAHHTNQATIYTEAWHRTGDFWQAISACAQWRKADRAAEALTIAEQALGRVTDQKPRSATLTTRGGALRDLKRYDEAERSGLEAHYLTPSDFRPCTLLGAVRMEMGDYAAGADWYAKAEARGATPDSVDRELKSILDAASREDRARMKAALLALDSVRFNRL